ncbi:cytochrome c oxidase assembly factor Coa1 family protein [Aquimarina sp. SS2-1]|uniref:cytochrome c oxidase assembly factor Coa1 family protein n=1 Tax=Aquimarina besae TaxID=3342247 RepID=UPI00366B8A5F
MTDYINKKSWWRKNRGWILGFFTLTSGFVMTVLILLGKPIGDFTRAMFDPSVYNNAFDTVNNDERVIDLLGELKPITVFEVLEGEVKYDEDGKAIITVGIRGSIQKGKMDIVATKHNNSWQYEVIRIRTKKPKKIIEVLDSK